MIYCPLLERLSKAGEGEGESQWPSLEGEKEGGGSPATASVETGSVGSIESVSNRFETLYYVWSSSDPLLPIPQRFELVIKFSCSPSPLVQLAETPDEVVVSKD